MWYSLKVAAFLLLVGSIVGARSETHANIETVTKLCSIAQKMMQGERVEEAKMQKMMSEMMGFYAPRIDCDFVSTSSEFGLHLVGVPASTCLADLTKKYHGMELVHFECENPTADESGKTVNVLQHYKSKMPTGRMLSYITSVTYHFDDDGKIASWKYIVDTSALSPLTQAAKNKATIASMCSIIKTIRGETVNQDMIHRLTSKMMGYYAPKVDCHNVPHNEEFGFHMSGVPASACFAELPKKYGGLVVVFMECEDPVVDESGKTVVLFQNIVAKLPTGHVTSYSASQKYDFNDDGKIVAWKHIHDTSVFSGLSHAAKNKATVAEMCLISKKMQGSTINETSMRKMMSQMEQFFAKKTDCDMVSSSKEFGHHLVGVPASDCFAEAAKKFVGTKIVDVHCSEPMADESGETVVSYEESKVMTPDEQMMSVFVSRKFIFNRDGKIMVHSTEFDTSILRSMTLAAKNEATIASMCSISKHMQGSTINKALMEKMMAEMVGFYAPQVDCDWVSTSKSFGFKLTGVPVSTFFAEATKRYAGMQVLDMECASPAADKSGKIVMMYQLSNLKLSTGKVVSLPMMMRYEFNDDGKVKATSTQFDTSVLTPSYVRSDVHSHGDVHFA